MDLTKLLFESYQKKEFVDITVWCGDRQKMFSLHKVVLCAHSDVFRGMCQSGFQEGLESHISLEDEKTVTFESVVEWMYTGDYSDKTVPSESEAEAIKPTTLPLRHHVEVYAFGDKYDITMLVETAQKKFIKQLSQCAMAAFKENQLPKAEELCVAMKLMYESTPAPHKTPNLRSEMLRSLRRYGVALTNGGAVSKIVMDCIQGIPELSSDLLANCLANPFLCSSCFIATSTGSYKCSRCVPTAALVSPVRSGKIEGPGRERGLLKLLK